RAGVRAGVHCLPANGGGHGVKPRGFGVRGAKRLVKPTLKVRCREYLRIIYGTEYGAVLALESEPIDPRL
ncbi:MAG: hypothetical protein NTV97_31710, partial [Alphaproteobacteria bacterium]|nr:hypothetical protein [Alphaproteobacteria bacterium]